MHVDAKTARLPAAAELVDDLTRVAEEFGVFVDLTRRQVAAPIDQTGGLDRLREILSEKSSANRTIINNDVDDPAPTLIGRIAGAIRTVKAWAKRAVKAVKDALAWLVTPAGVVHEYLRNRRQPELYTGRHRTAGAWYGAQRSTASRVAIQRRQRSGRQPTDSEPALPEYWVSHVARAIEAIRGHEDALHPKKGYQFIC